MIRHNRDAVSHQIESKKHKRVSRKHNCCGSDPDDVGKINSVGWVATFLSVRAHCVPRSVTWENFVAPPRRIEHETAAEAVGCLGRMLFVGCWVLCCAGGASESSRIGRVYVRSE